jgi:hypothetical protein
MADENYFDQMYGGPKKPQSAAPSAGKPEAAPAKDQNYFEQTYGAPKKVAAPTEEQKADVAYQNRVAGWQPEAEKFMKEAGTIGALAQGISNFPVLGPALGAAQRNVVAAFGGGDQNLSPEENTFAARKENIRAWQEAVDRAAKKQAPITRAVGEIGSSLALPFGGAYKSLQGAAAARGLGAGAQTAAGITGLGLEAGAYGAATAAGEKAFGTAPESQQEGILKSAAVGAGLGAGLGVAGKGIATAYGKLAPDWLKALGRTDDVQWRTLQKADQEDLAAGFTRPNRQDFQAAMANGQPVAVMDMFGPRAKAEISKIMEGNPNLVRDYQAYASSRLMDQQSRFEDFVNNMRQATTGTLRNPAELQEEARRLGSELSRQRYAAAYHPDNGIKSWKPEWDSWLNSPSFRNVVVKTENELRDAMALNGIDPVNFVSPFKIMGKVDPKTGQMYYPPVAGTKMPLMEIVFPNRINVEYLDTLQKNMNAAIKGKFGAEFAPQGESARGLANARADIIQSLTDPKSYLFNKPYAEARAKYAEFMDEGNAYNFGYEILKKVNNTQDAAKLAMQARSMTPQERQLATHGLLEDIMTRAARPGRSGQINPEKLDTMFNKRYVRDALESVLMPQNMANLERFVKTEALITRAANEAARMYPGSNNSQEVRTLLWGLFGGPTSAVARYIGLWAHNFMNEKYAQKLSQKLMSSDIKDFNEAYQMLVRNPQAMKSFSRFASTVPVIGATQAAQPGNILGNPTGFARGGKIKTQRDAHIHAATESLIAAGQPKQPMPPMARGGKAKKHPAMSIPGVHIRHETHGEPIFEDEDHA